MNEKRYYWTDGDGRSDLQHASAFQAIMNGWEAAYDAVADAWLAWPPYGGPARRYVRH